MRAGSMAGRPMATISSDHLGVAVVRSRISSPSGISTLVTYMCRLRRVEGLPAKRTVVPTSIKSRGMPARSRRMTPIPSSSHSSVSPSNASVLIVKRT